MARITFPVSPTLNQQYVQNGSAWTWDGFKWVKTAPEITQIPTASYVNVTGSGVLVNYGPGGQIQLTGSAGASTDTLQNVTTRGGASSSSINLTGPITASNLTATGSLFGTASWARNAISTSYALSSSYAATASIATSASYALSSSYALTASFVLSASYARSSSWANTSSVALTASYVPPLQAVTSQGNLTTSSLVLNGGVTGSSFTGSFTGSFKGTASFADNVILQGLGITVNGMQLTASVRTVNGIFPTSNGNVATSLNAVYVGDSGSFQVSKSLATFTGSLAIGSVWVFAGSTGSASGSNGTAYIYTTSSVGVGQWYELGSSDLAQYDARYLMLAGTNSPMQGNVNWGGYKIENLGNPDSSDDAINLGTLTSSLLSYTTTASFHGWTGSASSLFFGTSSYAVTTSYAFNAMSSSYALTASYASTALSASYSLTASLAYNAISSSYADTASIATSASYTLSASQAVSASNALTASYINVTGSNIFVNWNGSQLQLTASEQSNYFNLVELGKNTNPNPSSSGNWRLITSASNLNFEFWNTASSTWVADTIFTPEGYIFSGSIATASFANSASWAVSASQAISASYALTASYVLEKQNLQDVTTIGNQTSASVYITGSLTNGQTVLALGNFSHAEGLQTTAIGFATHTEGYLTTAVNQYSHTEGAQTKAVGDGAHAEGEGTTAKGFYSHAEGYSTLTLDYYAHAEGESTTAYYAAHSEGQDTYAAGEYSHAEGEVTTAIGNYSHAEGLETTTKNMWSHAEGRGTITAKDFQHVEGTYNIQDSNALWIVGDGSSNTLRSNLIAAYTDKLTITGSIVVNNTASGIGGNNLLHLIPGPNITITSGSTGYVISASSGGSQNLQDVTTIGNRTTGSIVIGTTNTFANGSQSFALGTASIASAPWSMVNGDRLLASGTSSHAEGLGSTAAGLCSHAEGDSTKAYAYVAHTEGTYTTGLGVASHAEGRFTTTVGQNSHAEGEYTIALGWASHTEGTYTRAFGTGSHAEGNQTTAVSVYDHAEGQLTTASGGAAHSEGYGTKALSGHTHAEGRETTAATQGAHSEGYLTTAIGTYAHTEGYLTLATASYAHAEGERTTALGLGSHAEGFRTTVTTGSYYGHAAGAFSIAGAPFQSVVGVFNAENQTVNTAIGYRPFIVGVGSGVGNRKNAFEVVATNTSSTTEAGTIVLPTYASITYANDTAAATGNVPLGGVYVTTTGVVANGPNLRVRTV